MSPLFSHTAAQHNVELRFEGAATDGEIELVEQPMTFELAVNLKTTKLLGLTMPPEIMVWATCVIQ